MRKQTTKITKQHERSKGRARQRKFEIDRPHNHPTFLMC
ncbi:MAG: hypothetical protein LC734_05565 [Acidobacteria bacterium]|nr:hypothetical protein [Acidobacteriota bacterium]